jgi:hypothetical protein
MSQVLFGQLLGRLVSLSRHDVEEILAEQEATRQRFGEIALSRGLCEVEHVWSAWCEQLVGGTQTIDLDRAGVDARAAAMLRSDTAYRLGVLPVRCQGDQIVVAIPADADPAALSAELSAATGKQPRFVTADARQLQRAIATYYPVTTAVA